MQIASRVPPSERLADVVRSPLRYVVPRSLRVRLVLWNVVALVVIISLLTLLINDFVSQHMVIELDHRMRTQAADLHRSVRVWQTSGKPFDATLYENLVQGVTADELAGSPLYMKFLDLKSGAVIAHSGAAGRDLVPTYRKDFESAAGDYQIYTTQTDASGRRVRTYTFPLHDDALNIIAVGQISQSLQEVEQTSAALFTVLLSSGIIAALSVAGAGFIIVRGALRPFGQLADTMQSLSAQGLKLRLSPQAYSSEAQVLADAFNQMLARLEASFTLQRDFVGDVSHELRTPLTAIRGQVDVLLLDPELKGEARRDVQQVSAELGRMSQLVTNLLTVARAEAGMLPQPSVGSPQSVELDLLLVELARQARFLNQQVNLKIGGLQQTNVPGDSDLLKQLLLNLVDNAMTYSRPGDTVTLGMNHAQKAPHTDYSPNIAWAVLTVRDTGPGIAPADLPHIFERHYRANDARARSKTGAGLGLSIAKLIAEAHGGTITVESELGKGTTFSVWLPTRRLPALSHGLSPMLLAD